MEWFDLLNLFRHRDQVLCLDSSVLVTRGNPVGMSAWMALLHPSQGSYTCTGSDESSTPAIIGQVTHRSDEPCAHITFLLPEPVLSSTVVPFVLDELICKAGEMGAFSVLAELDENHSFSETLRTAGFSVYAWQRIWKFNDVHLLEKPSETEWQPAKGTDAIGIRSLYQSLVPPIIQGIEPALPHLSPGWVLRRDSNVVAYAEGLFGTRGICLFSVFHPELENTTVLLRDLLGQITTLGRPVYLAVRLYQAHLERSLRELGASESALTTLMVKHLAHSLREEVLVKQRTPVRNRQAEPTAGMARNISK